MLRSERGQTIVEMALAAPLFFMVLIGIIVLGIGDVQRICSGFVLGLTSTIVPPPTSEGIVQ